MRLVQRRENRGAALIELAISVPLLLLVILATDFCYEIIQAKLKLQEASRFAAWEMTSFPLDDFGTAQHEAAYAAAANGVRASTEQRYSNLQSADHRLTSR